MAPPACPRAQTRGRALAYPQSEVIGGLGSGLRILNTPTPPVFEESVRYASRICMPVPPSLWETGT